MLLSGRPALFLAILVISARADKILVLSTFRPGELGFPVWRRWDKALGSVYSDRRLAIE